MTTIDNNMDRFPYPTVTLIIGRPGYKSISHIHLQLNTNTASVQSHLDNGTLGHLFLMVTPAVVNTLSATPLIPPPNPGQDHIIPTSSTGPQIADICDAHARETRVYKLFDSTYREIKQLILGAVDYMFVRALRNLHIRYANITLLQLMAHIYATYTQITAADLEKNGGKLRHPTTSTYRLIIVLTRYRTE